MRLNPRLLSERLQGRPLTAGLSLNLGAGPHKGRREDASTASFARTLGATTVPRSSIEQDSRLRLVADRHLHEIAVVAKNLVLSEDLGGDLIGRSDHQMAAGPAALIELRPR